MEINNSTFRLPESELIRIRKELYGSTSPGYYVFKKFLPDFFVQHMVTFWTGEDLGAKNFVKIKEVDKKKQFYFGCPNYLYPTPYGKAYYNYFWNQPADEVTYSVSWNIQTLRNMLESVTNYNEFFPITGNSCSYRVVFSLNGGPIVRPHTDWLEPKELFNPARLQATLILTKKGVDYSGTGMWMMSNDKTKKYVFDEDIQVEPGDLVLWRYNNEHAVQDIKSEPGQKGFIRMIFPPEFIKPRSKEMILDDYSGKELFAELKKRAKRKIIK